MAAFTIASTRIAGDSLLRCAQRAKAGMGCEALLRPLSPARTHFLRTHSPERPDIGVSTHSAERAAGLKRNLALGQSVRTCWPFHKFRERHWEAGRILASRWFARIRTLPN